MHLFLVFVFWLYVASLTARALSGLVKQPTIKPNFLASKDATAGVIVVSAMLALLLVLPWLYLVYHGFIVLGLPLALFWVMQGYAALGFLAEFGKKTSVANSHIHSLTFLQVYIAWLGLQSLA